MSSSIPTLGQTRERDKEKLFIRVAMWENDSQDYIPVGTLMYDYSQKAQAYGGFVGFVYDRLYLEQKKPALDPAHLNPAGGHGAFTAPKDEYGMMNGTLPYYFRTFLPNDFADSLMAAKTLRMGDNYWRNLNQFHKFYTMTYINGDYGAPQFFPRIPIESDPVIGRTKLSEIVKQVREFQNGELAAEMISDEVRGALSSLNGRKPKIDYMEEANGVADRFVVKLNTTGHYNDARVGHMLGAIASKSGVDVASSKVVQLSNGEEVLFSRNFTRETEFEANNTADGVELVQKVYKYNRVPFSVLLADDASLKNTQKPTYAHFASAIRKYSSDPATDLLELYRRAFVSAATNNTTNGLDNMELVDLGGGNWRLAPMFSNLPNPFTDAEYAVSFREGICTQKTIRLDEVFLLRLSDECGIDPTDALAAALPIASNFAKLDVIMQGAGLLERDKETLRGIVRTSDMAGLAERLGSDKEIVNHAHAQYEQNQNKYIEAQMGWVPSHEARTQTKRSSMGMGM